MVIMVGCRPTDWGSIPHFAAIAYLPRVEKDSDGAVMRFLWEDSFNIGRTLSVMIEIRVQAPFFPSLCLPSTIGSATAL